MTATCMTATWTITRLPSQVRIRPPAERSKQFRRERLTRRANGIPDPSTWMW